MNGVQGLLRNRKVLTGAAVVAGVVGLAVVARLRRNASTTGTDPSSSDGTGIAPNVGGGGAGGGLGTYDSTSADVASQLSAYGQATQNALDSFGNQLTTSLDALQNPAVPAPSGTGIGGTSPSTPTTPVTPAKPDAHQLHQAAAAHKAHEAAAAHKAHETVVANRKLPTPPKVTPPKPRKRN